MSLTLPSNAEPSPLLDRVLVRLDEPPEMTEGGIALPQNPSDQGEPVTGTVIAVGPGRIADNGTRIPPELKTGCRVVVGSYAGLELTLSGKKHKIVRESEVGIAF